VKLLVILLSMSKTTYEVVLPTSKHEESFLLKDKTELSFGLADSRKLELLWSSEVVGNRISGILQVDANVQRSVPKGGTTEAMPAMSSETTSLAEAVMSFPSKMVTSAVVVVVAPGGLVAPG
jgi:hypothetical protein